MSPGPGPQYRQGPQMYAAPEQQAPAPAPSNDGPGFFEGLFRPTAMTQAFSGLNGKGGLLGKTGGGILGGLMGGYQVLDSIFGEGGFADNGLDADTDSYMQGAQGLLGLGGVAMANPYMAAGAAAIGLGRRGEDYWEDSDYSEYTAGSAWERSKNRVSEADGFLGTSGALLKSGGDLLRGGAMNLAGGVAGVASDIGNFFFD